MPQLAAADAFFVLEFIAGNRCIPHAVFAALLASLPSSSSPRTSPRLRKALVLRSLHAALDSSCSFITTLRNARRVLADPDAAACFPNQLSFAEYEEDDGGDWAAAAVADLKRLLDYEWANLPPSTLELAADRLAGHRPLKTGATAGHANREKLRLLGIGESTERDILAKLMQDASASHLPIPPEAADNPNDANEADVAGRTNGADHAQQGTAGHQTVSIEGAQGVQLPEEYVPATNKRNLMEKHANAYTYEWDGLGDSDDGRPVGKRQLPPFERKSHPSPACAHKIRKKWSEIEEKTLLEGVEKYGKGNWKDIKMAYPDVFQERSTIDLKDKFRNMERYHESA
ncbi:unnamed protein product [Urochloa decumbens]|uniref:Uncharacterized protein n=1 Tax=Urochloa decumbens TaxID=240449 RepID=A0ABC9EQA2_9POAL